MQRTTTNHAAIGRSNSVAAVRYNTPKIPLRCVGATTDHMNVNATTDTTEQPPRKKHMAVCSKAPSEGDEVVTTYMDASVHAGSEIVPQTRFVHQNETPPQQTQLILSSRPMKTNVIAQEELPRNDIIHQLHCSQHNETNIYSTPHRIETGSISDLIASLSTESLPLNYSGTSAASPLGSLTDYQPYMNLSIAAPQEVSLPNSFTSLPYAQDFHMLHLLGSPGIKSMPRSTHNFASQDTHLAYSNHSDRLISGLQVGTTAPILEDMLRGQHGPRAQNLVPEALQTMTCNGGSGLTDQQRASSAATRPTIALRLPAILGQSSDIQVMNEHQAYLRQQIEVFMVTQDDIDANTRGRHRRIQIGQVGIRCRHCAHIPARLRQKGTAYFPATMRGLYQAAQNMSTNHIQCGLCTEMPESVKTKFIELWPTRNRASQVGSRYWEEEAKRLGLVDTDNRIAFQV